MRRHYEDASGLFVERRGCMASFLPSRHGRGHMNNHECQCNVYGAVRHWHIVATRGVGNNGVAREANDNNPF